MQRVPQQFLEIIRRHSRPLEPLPTGVAPVLKELPDVKCVLWDIYGTLFISGSGEIGTGALEAKQQALSQTLQTLQIEANLSPGELLACYEEEVRRQHELLRQQGAEVPEIQVPRLWQALGCRLAEEGRWRLPPEAAQPWFWHRFALEYEVRSNPVWPMPGVESVLHRLRNSGILLGLVSNSQFYTPLLFPALLGRELPELGFDQELLLFSYQFGEAKPGTFLYREARRRLQQKDIRPDQVVYVGNDMRNDVLPAQACGFLTALFAGDRRSFRPRPEDPCCREAAPTLRLTQLQQLLSCLAGCGGTAAEVVT